MGDTISVSVKFNTDDEGFLSQECPNCQKRFKVRFGEGSDKPISFCPYCSHQDQNCWWTQAQADYMAAVAGKTVIEPELERMARDFSREAGSGGFISMKIEVKSDPPPVPPQEPSEDWPVALFDCCNERIRHDRSHASLHCVICGKDKTANA
jgi:ribosomal protein S27E